MSPAGQIAVGRDRFQLLQNSDWVWWSLILAFLAVGIGWRSPWPADEPRFALIAMDMVQNGHWLLPHRGGEVYADKPPMFMWLQALAYAVTGNMKIAFLLPSLLAAAATLWMVYDLARRLFDRRAAWFAVLLLLSTVQFVLQAKTAQIDATLMGFTTLGLYGLIRHHILGPRHLWSGVAWLAMGCGIITKGVGFLPLLMLPGLYWVRHHDQLVEAHNSPWKRAMPLLLLVPALAWLGPLFWQAFVLGNPEVGAYLQELLFRQTVTRYVEGLGHIKPAWYYLVEVIPWFWMPVSLVSVWLLPDWIRKLKARDPVCWSLVSLVVLGVLFFSLSAGKRGVYMLPLLPAVALLAAGSIQSVVGRAGPNVALRIVTLLLGLVIIVIAGLTNFGYGPLPPYLLRYDLQLMTVTLFLTSMGAVLLIAGSVVRHGSSFLVAFMMLWLLYCSWGYPMLDPVRSADDLMQRVENQLPAGAELAIVGFREQQLLQAHTAVTHWGFSESGRNQLADAIRWLGEGAPRYLLISEQQQSNCFPAPLGKRLAYRHRQSWYLVALADLPAAHGCLSEAPTIRYVAPAVAYPGGSRL